MFEGGVQGRYYLLGSFENGMQIGAEMLGIYASTNAGASSGITATGTGLAVGPFLGYKYVAPFGLTLDLQGGVEVLAVSASGGGSSASAGAVIPLLNLNIGWSF